ncbi:hypothetical protein Tco_0385042 [Tanacetum coccineum]
MPLCNNPTPLEAFKEHSEIVIDFKDDSTSSDDDSPYGEDIDYVDASPPDSELISLEVVESVIPEYNPTPSSDSMTKSSSTSHNFFLEETNTYDNSLPESQTFCFDLEEKSSSNPTSRFDYSLTDHEVFYFDDDHNSSGSTTTHSDSSLYKYDSFIFDLSIDPFPPTNRSDIYHEQFAGELAHIISPPDDSLGSDLVVSFPSGTRNKIFDPGIFIGVQSKIFLSRDEFCFSFIRDPPSSSHRGFKASEDKSPPSSSHRAFKASKLSNQKA